MKPPEVMKALESGRIMAEFRGVTPTQRDQLAETLGDGITTTESPWLSNLLVVFNTGRKPFDDARVRRALSLAIDRWGAADLPEICRRADAPWRQSGDVGSRADAVAWLLA